jgi:hypothetical protein
MPTLDEIAKQPLEQRLSRITRTADDLAAAIRGQSEAALVRQPDAKNWAAKEVICHLRDTEELFRREETLAHLRGLSPEQWQRGGVHPRRGRITVGDFVTDIAWHDDNHLDQLRRALDGKA